MNVKKIITLLLALVLAAGMVACGAKQAERNEDTDKEPQTAEEAAALYEQLIAQENAIQAENTELWEKVFLSADKGTAMMEDGKNYGNQKYRGPAGRIGGKISQLIRNARRGWQHERTGGQRYDHAA